MDSIFRDYSEGLAHVTAWAAERWPRGDEPEGAWRSSIRAKALDLLRGLLPASTLSHVGIFASGQAYEQLLLRLFASPLPEAREYGSMILAELRQVIPSFVARVDRPERGGEWISYLQRAPRDDGARGRPPRPRPPRAGRRAVGRARARRRHRGRPARRPRSMSRRASSEAEIRRRVDALDPLERAELIAELVGERANRRHRPGRGWEAVRYRFEIVSDYGGFRDLQRHRMLTCQWQRLGPELGAGVPGRGRRRRRGRHLPPRRSRRRARSSSGSRSLGMTDAAPYALCLGYRIRYVLDLNAREAMHLCELRSGREGHPTYRAVAQAMHERIAAVHPAIAAGMKHVDSSTEPRLERIMSEIRAHRKRVAPGI